MSSQYVRVYDERTGNPQVDNRHRNMNRALNRVCQRSMRISTPKGRRRKKFLTRVEYQRYARVVAAVAEEHGLPR